LDDIARYKARPRVTIVGKLIRRTVNKIESTLGPNTAIHSSNTCNWRQPGRQKLSRRAISRRWWSKVDGYCVVVSCLVGCMRPEIFLLSPRRVQTYFSNTWRCPKNTHKTSITTSIINCPHTTLALSESLSYLLYGQKKKLLGAHI